MIVLGEEIISDPQVTAITFGTNGHLWVGTDGDGLFQFDGNRWERFDTANGLPTNRIRTLFIDRHGEMWIALTTGEGGGALVRYMP
jgi:ligand-binding sensor domain-containing protein